MENLFKSNNIDKLIKNISEVAGYLWDRGWAERNAGNLSVNITDQLDDDFAESKDFSKVELTESRKTLAGQVFLVSLAGSRMREIARNPYHHICIVKIDELGKMYELIPVTASQEKIMPTSELPTHLAIHEKLLNMDAEEKSVLHSHVTELIALTQIKEFCDQPSINKLLWGMHPETILFLPDGVGFVPYTLPGTEMIAEKTVNALENHKVILWEKHGCFAIGKNFDQAFDLLDILSKSAQIYFKVCGKGKKVEGLSDDQLNELKSFI